MAKKKTTEDKSSEPSKAEPLSAKGKPLSISSKKKTSKKKKSAKKKESKKKAKVEVKVAEKPKEKLTEKKPKEVIKAMFARERVITESTDEARNLFSKSAYGQVMEDGKVQLSLPEALYLLEKGKIIISEKRKKAITSEEFIKKARTVEPNFWIRYCVFKDMRNRGYIIKTALKFGADFRVYDRGIRPGEDHARWIIFPVHEGETLTWYEFAAKNRVAHSTKKRLMMGIVDDEGDVTYYEIKWMRP
ncbi:tRNA-intron lyase [Candidatus Woesearchaeota archaeon]|nr:tRNA-intron lyase [Candidatus Woesearchaeota archaeon]